MTGILALPVHESAGIDVYYFTLDRNGSVFNGKTGDELRHAFGVRFFGSTKKWDWNFEGFYQFGEFASGDILAWSFASSTGYTFPELFFSPRLGLKVDFISGDENPNDDDIGTFSPLFPKGKYFGELTPLGPENLINVQPSLTLNLTDKLQLLLNTVFYWRCSTDDAIYDLGGGIVRPAGRSNASFIGTEWEAIVSYQFNRNLEGTVSYSQFHAGDFIKETGPDKTIRLVGLELLFKF